MVSDKNTGTSKHAWKPLLALLAHEETRVVFAQLVLGIEPTLGESANALKRTAKARSALAASGVLVGNPSRNETDFSVFKSALVAQQSSEVDPLDRFLENGRIKQFPAKSSDVNRLLIWAQSQLEIGRDGVSEKLINEQLTQFTDDPALVRRSLVDAGLLVRDRTGSCYTLPTGEQHRG